jgi:hypothetical protein
MTTGHTFLLTLSERSEPKGLFSLFEVFVIDNRSLHFALRAPVGMTELLS